jgi:hypothetical protein
MARRSLDRPSVVNSKGTVHSEAADCGVRQPPLRIHAASSDLIQSSPRRINDSPDFHSILVHSDDGIAL